MSTVVYRDGIMAADSRAYGGSGSPSPGWKQKVHRLPDGSVVGVATAVIGMAERFVAWLAAGADPDGWGGDVKPDLRAIMVKPDGTRFLAEDAFFWAGPIETDFFAIGSGSAYATGALARGASAVEAVEVAILYDHHSGGTVSALSVR